MGDPRMTKHLGGSESPDKLRERQGRYGRLEGGDHMFKIVDVATGAGVGSVGFWRKEWRNEQVYEVGWMLVPELQGRGIAAAATIAAQASPDGLGLRDHGRSATEPVTRTPSPEGPLFSTSVSGLV